MPIYEYQCAVCGARHEALQKLNAPLLRDCPECGRPDLVKLVTVAGFRLAGSGWYETDFKTGDKRNLATGSDARPDAGKDPAPGKESAASGGSTADKNQKKPEKKPESKPAGRPVSPAASE